MRCFIALSLPDSVLRAVAAFEDVMRGRLRGLRWAGMGSHHVTLAFLGDINGSGIDCAAHAIRAMSALRPLSVRFGPPGGFPPHGPYKVIMLPLGDAAEPGLALLGAEARSGEAEGPREERGPGRLHGAWIRLNEALRAAELRHGIERLNEEYPSGKPFRPHATLARAHADPVPRKALAEFAPLASGLVESPFLIDACTVYESRPGRDGAEYVPLETARLAGTED